ncbi:MAG TPA: TatD family hydrolase [Spirochaetota bacterium]|nr:TatD family hydrolase [Spirochaetota bacterium]HPS85163.1 TatD family hydrolase [Spirochaetota bacterium]
MILDSHVHFNMILDDNKISEADIIKSLKYNNIEYAVQISVEEKDFIWSRDFAKRNYENGIFYTLGIHPSSPAEVQRLSNLASLAEQEMNGKYSRLLLGIGECGLDYYRMHQAKEMQVYSFETQIDIAKKYKLPLIIHSREAMEDTLEILKNKKYGHGIMHCFAGDSTAAKRVLDMGFMISFAGNVTYKNAEDLHDAAKYVPLDRILVETDSPFLSPVPMRGKPNLPENIKHTYKFISSLKKVPLAKLEDSVTENFTGLLRK